MTCKFVPYLNGDSAHFTSLPDIGEWKFQSDFFGDRFRYVNPNYEQHLDWVRRRGIWTPKGRITPVEWRIVLPNGDYDRGLNGKVREFKSPERAIRALEIDFEPR